MIIEKVHLIDPHSPKKAFYDLWLESISDGFLVCKASGIQDKVLDRESWFRSSLDEARTKFQRIIKSKTNPNRKSPRKYSLR